MERYTFEIKNGVYKQPQYDYVNVSDKAPMQVNMDFVFTGYKVFFAFTNANDKYLHPFKIEASTFDEWKKQNPNIFISFGFANDIPKERIVMFDDIDDNGGQQYSGDDCGCAYATTTLMD